MALPKKSKNDIQIYEDNKYRQPENITGNRQALLDRITKSDVFLPDAVLHDDLDAGMLDFIKSNFVVISDGTQIPVVDKILTIQRWAEFSNNWQFSDSDDNITLPFIVLIRKPDPQPGSNPTTYRTIPNRRNFHYQTIKKIDSNGVIGADVYKIPQPVAVDISYNVTIVCNRFRDLNKLNKQVLQLFSSRQAYTSVKGHYIPIILDSISDSSPIESIDNRRFYVQTYSLIMLGLLIDPEEFEVKPAISRALLMNEFIDTPKGKKTSITKSVQLTSVSFVANGVDMVYNVSEKITQLFYITINGLLQEIGVDFYFVAGTSKITFVSEPPAGSIITIVYYKGKDVNFVNSNEIPVILAKEYFTYTGTLTFTLAHTIDAVVIVDINGLTQELNSGYTIGADSITLLEAPYSGSTIGVTYFYEL